MKERATYVRAGSEELDAGGCLTVIEGSGSADHFVVHQENDIHAAVPVAERPDGSYELLLPGDVPRLFKFLPLVNSADVGLPAVFHSPLFSTTENRDGLVFAGQRPAKRCQQGTPDQEPRKCFLRLARNCAKEGLDDLYLLLNVSEVSDFPAWLEDRSWYADWQRSMIRELAGIPLVRMENEETAPVSDADLPLGDDDHDMAERLSAWVQLAADWVPLEAVAEGCSAIAEEWTGLLGDDDPLIKSCVLTPGAADRKGERDREPGKSWCTLELERPRPSRG